MSHRIQWIGFKEAPLNTYLSCEAKLTKAMALGIIINQQRTGILNKNDIALNYSYALLLAEKHEISFGLNINFLHNMLIIKELNGDEYIDPTIYSNKFDESLIASGAGILYKFNGLKVSIFSPYLFSSQENVIFQHVNTFLEYDFNVSDKIKISPSTLLKYQKTSPFQADINIRTTYQDIIWIQPGYRTNKNIIFATGILVKNIAIAYAYEINLEPTAFISKGSHEIMLQFKSNFKNKKTD